MKVARSPPVRTGKRSVTTWPKRILRTVGNNDDGQKPNGCIFADTRHSSDDTSAADEDLASHHKICYQRGEHVRQVTKNAEAYLRDLKEPAREGQDQLGLSYLAANEGLRRGSRGICFDFRGDECESGDFCLIVSVRPGNPH